MTQASCGGVSVDPATPSGKRKGKVITTISEKDDTQGDLYHSHLKKLTNHFRKGVLAMSETMNTEVPSAIKDQHTKEVRYANMRS